MRSLDCSLAVPVSLQYHRDVWLRCKRWLSRNPSHGRGQDPPAHVQIPTWRMLDPSSTPSAISTSVVSSPRRVEASGRAVCRILSIATCVLPTVRNVETVLSGPFFSEAVDSTFLVQSSKGLICRHFQCRQSEGVGILLAWPRRIETAMISPTLTW